MEFDADTGCASGDTTCALPMNEGKGLEDVAAVGGDVDVGWLPNDKAVLKFGNGFELCV